MEHRLGNGCGVSPHSGIDCLHGLGQVARPLGASVSSVFKARNINAVPPPRSLQRAHLPLASSRHLVGIQ